MSSPERPIPPEATQLPIERISRAQEGRRREVNLATALNKAAVLENLVRIAEIAARKKPNAQSLEHIKVILDRLTSESKLKDVPTEPYVSEIYGALGNDFSPEEIAAMEDEATTLAEKLENQGFGGEEAKKVGALTRLVKLIRAQNPEHMNAASDIESALGIVEMDIKEGKKVNLDRLRDWYDGLAKEPSPDSPPEFQRLQMLFKSMQAGTQ